MNNFLKFLIILTTFILVSCSDEDEDPILTTEVSIAIGDSACPYGGVAVRSGKDTNENGYLDPEEVTSVTTNCNNKSDLPNIYLGSEQGIYLGENDEVDIISFKGLPFAAPPVGDLRFRDPAPTETFSGIRQATAVGSSCSSAEDCLYLNVIRPEAEGNYPVMVWIHGGSFTGGSGGDSFYMTPYRLVRQGVIVVTINYRLGFMGFLATTGLAAEQNNDVSNYGIKDQQAALAWVKENALAFDGDPNNVTVFGQSAGGHSVLTHFVAPTSQGLFDKGISHSGVYLPDQLDIVSAIGVGNSLVQLIGCTGDDVACLRAATFEQMREAQRLYPGQITPVVGTPFLPVSFNAAIAGGLASSAPIMLGTTGDELSIFIQGEEYAFGEHVDTPEGFDAAIPRAWTNVGGIAGASLQLNQAQIDRFKELYPYENYENDVSLALSKGGTDGVFQCNLLNISGKLSATNTVFTYEWNDTLSQNIYGSSPLFNLGSGHGFELPYIFFPFRAAFLQFGYADASIALGDDMVSFWANFAKSTDPGSSTNGTIWQDYSNLSVIDLNVGGINMVSENDFMSEHNCVNSGEDIVWDPDTLRTVSSENMKIDGLKSIYTEKLTKITLE